MLTNWFGLKDHITDQCIDWKCYDPVKKAEKLRAAYDKIVAFGLEDEVKLLLQTSYDQGKSDGVDRISDRCDD